MRYFGTYERFELPPDADIGQILSADNSVGDIYTIKLDLKDGEYTAYLINAFDKTIGFFDPSFSKKLALLSANGLKEKAILSFIAYTADDDKGKYWGEMCVICYDPAYEEQFDRFIDALAARISDDVRPVVDFGDDTAKEIIDSDGNWLPSQNVILPDQSKDRAYIKRRKRMVEKAVDMGRSGNKGCYVASWGIIILVVVLIVLGIMVLIGN